MFNCVCMDYDNGLADFQVSRTVKARKTYGCCECKGTISPGDKHEYIFMVSDGCNWTYRTCAICLAVISDMSSCGRVYGALWATIRDVLCECETDEDASEILGVPTSAFTY